MANTFTKLGSFTTVAQADIENLQHAANRKGDTRVGGDAMGKRAGVRLLMNLTAGGSKEIFALGGNSSDAYRSIDGAADYTPVNLLNLTGGAAWTLTTATFTSSLLTATGAAAVNATQDVVLKAGTYYVSGEATAEGTAGTHDAPKLVITGATDGIVLTDTYNAKFHATAAELATDREAIGASFTIAVDQTVTFDLSNVNQTGATAIGSSYISLNLLEAQ